MSTRTHTAGTFAFTVHPRARLGEDLARVWSPLGRVPDAVYDTALRRLPLPPVSMAGIHIGGEHVGHVVLVPFGARHLLESPGEGRARVHRAVDKARALGCDVVGLGALTATVTAGGVSLRSRTDIGVTNGNAFTAAIVDDQARRLLRDAVNNASDPHVAVVGATGSVGAAVTRLLARDLAAARLTLVARSTGRLESIATEVGRRVPAATATSMDAVADADLVILLTASAEALLGPEHLRPGAVVLDATQPRNTSPSLVDERPDVLVVDGGVVDIPSLRLVGGDIGLPDGRSYACFAETALLALSGPPRPLLHRRPGPRARRPHPRPRSRPLAPRLPRRGADELRPSRRGRPPHDARRGVVSGPTRPRAEHRVVLLGGGYVTLHAYAGLMRRAGRAVRRGDVQVVVISTDDAHSFHGFTGEVLAGLLPYDRTRTPLVAAMPHAHVILGRALSIDATNRVVRYERVDEPGERVLDYDTLVVGTGGREPATTVPGLAEHGFTLRAPGDIAVLAERVRAAAAHRGLRRRTVVVAGGGLAGVEMAAAVADLGDRVRVELVHSGDHLLPELRGEQPRLADRAEHELRRLGVRVRLGVRLASVTADSAVLSDGTTLPAQTVVATIGQRPVQVPGLDAHRDPRGRLVTRPDLSVVDGVWAAGDAACVVHPRSGLPVPANALWAIKGGEHVGANLARTLRGRPTTPFAYRGLGQAASFGFGRSISELYGIPFTGWLAWVLRLTFFLRFMPSRRKAAQVALDFARLARRGRTPLAGTPTQRAHAAVVETPDARTA